MLPTLFFGEAYQVLSPDHPRRARASLSAFDLATAEHTQRRHVADADEFCCRFERDLAALRPLAVAEDGDVVVIAEAAYAGAPAPRAACSKKGFCRVLGSVFIWAATHYPQIASPARSQKIC
jgi:hypothetical protein